MVNAYTNIINALSLLQKLEYIEIVLIFSLFQKHFVLLKLFKILKIIGGTMNRNIAKVLIFVILLISIIGISIAGCVYFKNREDQRHNIESEQGKNQDKDLDKSSDSNTENENNLKDNTDNINSSEKIDSNNENAADGTSSTVNDSENKNNDDIKPGPGNTNLDGNNGISDTLHIEKPDTVKALYLTGWTAGDTTRLNYFVELAKKTEINAYVVDIKDDDGLVGYESELPAVKEIKAWLKKYNVDKAIKTFHDNGIYVIGRVVCFKDPVLSSKRADLAVKNSSGGLWRDNNNMTWLDPYNRDSWPYLLDIAKEAVKKGFDEIQFDYIRFPNDGNKKAMSFNNEGVEKYNLINEFISYAKKELPDVILSADVFGIICESPKDTEDIGQYLELIGKDIEYISPMVYPSHYALGQIVNNVKFTKPDLEPYAVVYNSLLKAKNRLSEIENYKADIRPYLQGFTASWLRKGNYQVYGPNQIREQINAVYDAGFKEWIIWDPSNKYPEDAFEKVE